MKRIAVLAILASGLAFPQGTPSPEPIGKLEDIYNGMLRPDVQVNTFRHIDRLFPTRIVHRGNSVYPLPVAATTLKNIEFTSGNRKHDLIEYLSLNRVSGLLILKDGKIVLEDYELGNTDKTRWVSWSMAKSICSTLVAAAVKDGYISSLDDPLTKYMPELKGGAYDGVTVRNALQMSSGVKWDETYNDPKSDRRRMLDLQIAQKPGAIINYLSSLPRESEPATLWKYSTGETHMIGALIRAAVKRPLADYLSDRIWSRFGMEDDATWWLESPGGLEVGGSGFSATLRDYGRFGQFILNGGKAGTAQVIPEGWFSEAGVSHKIGGKLVDYGYMWWTYGPSAAPANQGAFRANGIFGQSLYINPAEHVVIVVWSARPKTGAGGGYNDNDFFAGTVEALRH
jgi:CubicO group peptidase (beta-lactamase class C family)